MVTAAIGAEVFEETPHEVLVGDHMRPVLKYRGRLYVGETLCILNPNGFGGRVWTAKDLELLSYNVNFNRGESSGPGN